GQRALTHDGSPSWAFSDNRLTHGPTCQQVVVRPVPSGRVTPYRAAPRQDAQVSALPLWIAVTGLRRHGRLRWAPIMCVLAFLVAAVTIARGCHGRPPDSSRASSVNRVRAARL